jgi:hypothetical protein
MLYKAIFEDNLSEIGLCIEEYNFHKKELPKAILVFMVDSQTMSDIIFGLTGKSEEKEWAVMIVKKREVDDTKQSV